MWVVTMFVDTRKVCNMRRKRSKYGTLGTLTLKRKVGEPGKEKRPRKL